MSQGRKRTDKRNEFKICNSYPSSLESSCSKDDSSSKITSVSYSSEDQEIRHKNFHNSKKSHTGKSLKSPLVLRKDTDSNDSGFRRDFDYSDTHKTRHHHHFLKSEDLRKEKPNCHKVSHSEKNKRGSESSREKKSKIVENERFRRFSSSEIHGFSDRFSCNSFNSERKKGRHPKRSLKCNHIHDSFEKNRIKNEKKENDRGTEFFKLGCNEDKDDPNFSQGENEKIKRIEESIEGSARTRGFYFKNKEDRENIQDGRNIHSLYIPEKKSKNESSPESKNQSRKEKDVEKLKDKYFNSFDSGMDKTKKIKKISNKEIKISDVKVEQVLKNNSNPTTERSSKSRKSRDSSRKSSKDRQKKLNIKDEMNKHNTLNLESENEISKKEITEVPILVNDSEKHIENNRRREIQEVKKSKKKNQKRKGTKYKNSRPEYKRKTLRYLIYLIRKVILSDREETKNEDTERRIKVLKKNSCITIKEENKIESGCESSGYDSLKNIQDRLSEINKNQNSEINFYKCSESSDLRNSANEIEFFDSEKYCVYKIYKSPDGEILLKESQSEEFEKSGYVIGKRISKEPERLLQLPKNTISEKNINELFSRRNNSTQTEINLTSRRNPRKKSWFRKSNTNKYESRSKKHFASLESTSNSSFPESSDFEQFNPPFRNSKKIYSPSSKKSLSNLPKPPAHFLKKSIAVDTSDLIYFTSVKNHEDKMVFLFNNSENEMNSEYLDPKRENRFLNLDATSFCDKTKLEDNIRSNIFSKKSSEFSFEVIKSDENVSSTVPPVIPVSWFKLDNSEFIAEKINLEEMIRVQMQNNCNFIQSTEFQIKNPELVYSEGNSLKKQKKPSKNFFRIFKRKKKYDRIKFEENKVKM